MNPCDKNGIEENLLSPMPRFGYQANSVAASASFSLWLRCPRGKIDIIDCRDDKEVLERRHRKDALVGTRALKEFVA